MDSPKRDKFKSAPAIPQDKLTSSQIMKQENNNTNNDNQTNQALQNNIGKTEDIFQQVKHEMDEIEGNEHTRSLPEFRTQNSSTNNSSTNNSPAESSDEESPTSRHRKPKKIARFNDEEIEIQRSKRSNTNPTTMGSGYVSTINSNNSLNVSTNASGTKHTNSNNNTNSNNANNTNNTNNANNNNNQNKTNEKAHDLAFSVGSAPKKEGGSIKRNHSNSSVSIPQSNSTTNINSSEKPVVSFANVLDLSKPTFDPNLNAEPKSPSLRGSPRRTKSTVEPRSILLNGQPIPANNTNSSTNDASRKGSFASAMQGLSFQPNSTKLKRSNSIDAPADRQYVPNPQLLVSTKHTSPTLHATNAREKEKEKEKSSSRRHSKRLSAAIDPSEIKRFQIADRLLQSETDYVLHLTSLLKIYYKPMKKMHLVSKRSLKSQAKTLQKILKYHRGMG